MVPTDTKERILDQAERLLQDIGYSGLSYSQISNKLGIKNAAVHYHFPSKADLGAAMIQRFQSQFESYRTHMDRKYGDDPARLLEGYIAIPRSFLAKDSSVCPLGILEADFMQLPDQMRQSTIKLSRSLRHWLQDILEKGRNQGVFAFDGPADDKALLVSATLQGAALMAVAEDTALYERAVEQLRRELNPR